MTTLTDDMLNGADAIADYLGWKTRQVYHARERGTLPIRKREGVGVYAFKSELEKALKANDSLPPALRQPE